MTQRIRAPYVSELRTWAGLPVGPVNGWGPALQNFRPRAVDPKGMGGNPSFTDPQDYSLTIVRLYKLRLNKAK